MGAPPKKDPSLRANRSKGSTRATLTALDPEDAEIPDLPENPAGAWQAQTLEWWQEVWCSPMAGEFVQADIHGLFRLAMLVDEYWVMPSTKLHAEIRIAQQAYGLTPYDRRRLEWSIEGAEAAKDRRKTRSATQAPQAPATSDPRLKIVN